MACKTYFIGVLLASLAILALTNAANLTVGKREWGDHPIQFDKVEVPSKWLQIVKEQKTFPGDGRSNITQILLVDNNKKGNGATATVIAGGTGKNYVTVKFVSKRGHSINFNVEIYGK